LQKAGRWRTRDIAQILMFFLSHKERFQLLRFDQERGAAAIRTAGYRGAVESGAKREDELKFSLR